MAKLTGVKTIDMVNGEITKIEYDGAEYAKVDEHAQAGDVVQVVGRSWGTIEKGDFYIAKYTDGRFTHIEFPRRANGYTSDFEVFRKITADKPALDSRVDALEERVDKLEGKAGNAPAKPQYKTENRHAKVGERILIANATQTDGKYANGDVLTVKEADIWRFAGGGGTVHVEEHDRQIYPEEYAVIVEDTAPANAKPAQTIEHNGATYELVSRKAQPGDVVVFTENEYRCLENGTPYKVEDGGGITDRDGDYAAVYNRFNGRTEANVLVYAPVAQPKPKTGDIVVITANTSYSNNKVGDIGKVGRIAEGMSRAEVLVPGGPTRSVWTEFAEMRLATPAEVAEYEVNAKPAAKPKTPKLSEGDYAKTLKDGEFGDIKAGTIVEITDLDCGDSYDSYEICAELPDGGEHDYFRPQDLEKLDGKDVAFAKLGRKPNEFKKGDIVRVLDDEEYPELNGKLAEVSREPYGSCGGGNVELNEGTALVLGEDIKLIAPVESRVDVV
ncbi:hypothetical protein [Sporosarcina sp. SAFN-015]|uniref:hypothetical protein n=1 Tax=Sporosarcina sp. SAFN-015 TaxID=3387274 RepID=UPI003F7CFDDB